MGASIIYMYINTVCKYKTFFFTSFGKMTFRVAISTETDPQGTGRIDIPTHPYTPAAYAAGVVTKTTDKDSLRYTYDGTRRVRQLALGCESN